MLISAASGLLLRRKPAKKTRRKEATPLHQKHAPRGPLKHTGSHPLNAFSRNPVKPVCFKPTVGSALASLELNTGGDPGAGASQKLRHASQGERVSLWWYVDSFSGRHPATTPRRSPL